MSGAQLEDRCFVSFEQPVINQPLTCILGIALEPRTGIAQPKAVAPGVHVGHQAITSDAVELTSEYDLQVADRRFLEVIAARVGFELLSPVAGHADDVTGFVQQRMQRGVTTSMNSATDDTGFTVPPETSDNRLTVLLHPDTQAIPVEQGFDRCQRHIGYGKHVLQRGDLLKYSVYQIADDRLTQKVFFMCLTEHKRLVVSVISGKRNVLWREQAGFAGH